MGLEATRQIRQNPQIYKIPIIGMSAHALQNHKKEALNAGLNDYLPKPLDLKKLERVIWKYLNKSVENNIAINFLLAHLLPFVVL